MHSFFGNIACGKMMLLCLSCLKRQLSRQKLSAVARTLHVQPGWGTSVASGRPAAVWFQEGSVPAAAAFLYSTLRPAWLLSWPGLPASSPPACSKFPCLWAYFHPECMRELRHHPCLYACPSSLPRQGVYSKLRQQERIYRKASVAHALLTLFFLSDCMSFDLGSHSLL